VGLEPTTLCLKGRRGRTYVPLSYCAEWHRVAATGTFLHPRCCQRCCHRAWLDRTNDQRRALISMALARVVIAPGSKPGMPRFDPSRVRVVG